MDSNNLKKSKLFYNKIIIAFFALVVCFTSGHAMQTINSSLQLLIFPVFCLLLGPVIKKVLAEKVKVATAAVLIFALMVSLTTIVGFGYEFLIHFKLFVFIVVAFGITIVYSFEDFIKAYLNIMTVVAAVAIVGYYLSNETNALSFLPTYSNVNEVEYKIGWIFNYIVAFPSRNCGMFWEPGLFATNLALALMFEISFKKTKISIFRIILFSWAMITSNSSAGFFLLFCCAWLLFTKEKRGMEKRIESKNDSKVFFTFLKLILFAIGFVIVLNLDDIITGTALKENKYFLKLLSDNVSSSSRARAILFNLEIFIKNPFAGAGYSAVVSRMGYVADTSTSFYIMSVYGFLGSFYTIFWLYGIFKNRRINVFSKILICIIILSIINKEPHLNILSTWIILFYFLKDIADDKEKKQDELEKSA